jgi:hypothetical protein
MRGHSNILSAHAHEVYMKATVKWVGEVGFAGESETGHTLMMDGAPLFCKWGLSSEKKDGF